MSQLATILTGLCAGLHVFFFILESVLWTKPIGLKIFRQSKQTAQISAKLAMNQGLYNGFLAAGLFWSLCSSQPEFSQQLKLFFLSCVAIAGIVGAVTVNRRIFFVQAAPALAALFCLILT